MSVYKLFIFWTFEDDLVFLIINERRHLVSALMPNGPRKRLIFFRCNVKTKKFILDEFIP